MGLLDELKAEAQQVKTKEEQENQAALEKRRMIEEAIGPTLRKSYKYFKELKQQLEVIKPELHRTFEVRGLGWIQKMQQGDYKIYTMDNPETVNKFTFQYAYEKPGRYEIKEEARTGAIATKDYLSKHSLHFKVRDPGDGSAIFSVEGKVISAFDFEGDVENACIKLRVKNLEKIGVTTHQLSPLKVDDAFLEEITKAVMHKENKVHAILGNVVSDDARRKLQEQLAAQKRDPAAPKPAKGESKLKGLFGRK